MITKIRQVKFSSWSVPIALLVLCIAAFGILITRLGFYWDDWAKILVNRIWGLSGYWAYYADDRPLSGWTHIILTPILGNTPLAWQAFALLARWLGAVGLWWSLRSLWPTARYQAVLVAFIYLVYPVFTQQPIAVTFHQQWLQFALYFISLGLMIQAFRQPRRYWLFTVLALIATGAQLTVTEYFVGLEMVRPLVVWFLINEDPESRKQSIWKRLLVAGKFLLPYLLLFLAFVLWRLFFIKLPGEDPYRAGMLYRLFSQPLSTLSELFKTVFVDSFYVLVTAWAPPLDIGLVKVIPSFNTFTWIIAALTILLSAMYLLRTKENQPEDSEERRRWLLQAVVIGLVALVMGCLPPWIADRRVIDDFHSNRYAQPAMFGAALLWVAVVEWISPRRLQKAILVSAMVGLAVIFHLRTADAYRQIWDNQLSFYWQLSWRAPFIKGQTAILSEEELFPNQGGFSISAALNLLYPKPQGVEYLKYWFYGLRPRFVESTSNPTHIPLNTKFRILKYQGSTPDSLLVYFDPQRINCLWVLSPSDQDDPDLSLLQKQFLPASNVDRIIGQSPVPGYPPADLFGIEPDHDS